MKTQVCKSKCDQCLFSKNKIVTNKRKSEILKDCNENEKWFGCHKQENAICAGYFKEKYNENSWIQIGHRLGLLEFI